MKLPPAISLCLTMTLAPALSAQRLELPIATEPPELHEQGLVQEARRMLEQEITNLGQRERTAPPEQRPLLRASINLRILAAELVTRGGEAGASGSISVLWGYRFFQQREAFDAMLAQARAPDLRHAVKAFNDATLDHADRARTTDVGQLDASLLLVFAPLEPVSVEMLGKIPVSHWPSSEAIHRNTAAGDVPPVAPPERDPRDRLNELRDQLQSVDLPPDTTSTLTQIIDHLERGLRFHDLRRHVLSYTSDLEALLDYARAVAEADWIGPDQNAAALGEIGGAVEQFADRQGRAEARAVIAGLRHRQQLVQQVTELRSHSVDVRPIAQTLHALTGADARGDDDRATALARIVVAMIRFRQLPAADTTGDLRILRQRLNRAYIEAEEDLLAALPRLSAGREVLADPSFVATLSAQRRHLEDLHRFDRLSEWIARIEAVDPSSGKGFTREVKQMTEDLLDQGRRSSALRALSELDRQLNAFFSLPLEQEMAADEPAVAEAAGGFHRELLRVIAETRRGWVQAVSGGDLEDEAVQRMVILHRLLRAMEDNLDLVASDSRAALLHRWAGWVMPEGQLTRSVTDIEARLKLASAGAVRNDFADVRQQLDLIEREAPVAHLVAQLSRIMAQPLSQLPDGVAGMIGKAMHPPEADAFLIDRRQEIAELCRYALEAEYANSYGREGEAGRIRAFVNGRAHRLLDALESR